MCAIKAIFYHNVILTEKIASSRASENIYRGDSSQQRWINIFSQLHWKTMEISNIHLPCFVGNQLDVKQRLPTKKIIINNCALFRRN